MISLNECKKEGKRVSQNRRVHFIPPKPVKRVKWVGIYCRVR